MLKGRVYNEIDHSYQQIIVYDIIHDYLLFSCFFLRITISRLRGCIKVLLLHFIVVMSLELYLPNVTSQYYANASLFA